jgi:8-oxo-dGTP diphosphatase
VNTLLTTAWRKLSLPTGFQLQIMRVFQDQFLVGVTGVIFNEKNEVLLFKHTYRQTSWSLPGGYIKAKEHPFEALEREIEEESGLIISAEKQLRMRTDRENSRLDITILGKYIGGEFKQSKEVSKMGFFAFDKLPFISKNQLLLIESCMQHRNRKPLQIPAAKVIPYFIKFKGWFN